MVRSRDTSRGKGRESWASVDTWVPKTKLGREVKSGKMDNIHDLLQLGIPIKEVEIVDTLLPNLQDEIIDVYRVQRATDSGRRMRFKVVAAVGNGDGYVGIGQGKGKEVGPVIRQAIKRAKLNIKEVKRGCGSWECGCGTQHTVPFKVAGKRGSVSVTLAPAPRGVGLVCGDVAKKILTLAGISDAWSTTDGHTRSGLNFAGAVVNALANTNYVKIDERDVKNLNIQSGAVTELEEIELEGGIEGKVEEKAEKKEKTEEGEKKEKTEEGEKKEKEPEENKKEESKKNG
ncbi:MAG: 30S ribosomal protein S5 [Candidatus Altiarchaeales archaeon WOR_SM1_86-2]|nr:MAG: 30S ribosomal protein S5 [Candidatus Altiarchaeales archaeon WOR_SM1_86-2]